MLVNEDIHIMIGKASTLLVLLIFLKRANCVNWRQWGSWTGCSRSCGEGIRTRRRECRGGLPGIFGCRGRFLQTQDCHENRCRFESVELATHESWLSSGKGKPCLEAGKPDSYRGKIDRTISGIKCQNWRDNYPWIHEFKREKHPDKKLFSNHCRNPVGDIRGPWCFTTSLSTRWEYCDVPNCDDVCGVTKISLLDLMTPNLNEAETVEHRTTNTEEVPKRQKRSAYVRSEYATIINDWNITTQYPGIFENWDDSRDILATLASLNASNQMLDQIEARIANGKNAKAGAIPWMVSIRKHSTNKHFCGGALYGDSWVITAATCLPDTAIPSAYFVILGENKIYKTEWFEKEGYIVDIKIHESFTHFSFENDIALIQLSEPYERTSYMSPICLPTTNRKHGVTKIAGWGKPETWMPASSILLSTTTFIYPNIKCERELYGLTGTMLCGGKKSRSVCRKDEGSPMFHKNMETKQYELLGIAIRPDCGKKNTPALYTRVASFVEWIETNSQELISSGDGGIDRAALAEE